ncbi:cytochrome P450 4C1-like [Diadema setosum]|uniref:cytochrome P450 4C1-like n=1 Tax=Diadema setosum TaxID=31175 RepID=UPI003B3AC7E1
MEKTKDGYAVSLMVATAIGVAVTALVCYTAKCLRIFFLISKFHGPTALPIVGNTYHFSKDPREFFVNNTALANQYREKSGGVMRVWMGPLPCLIIYSPKHAKVILRSSSHIKKGFLYKFLKPWLGQGLLLSSGKKWFHRRKMLTPTFHFSILQNFMEVFNEQSNILAEKLDKFANQFVSVNIFPLVTCCVLDIICETAMGKHANAQRETDNEYVLAVRRLSDLILQRVKSPAMWMEIIFDNTEAGEKQRNYLNILHDVTCRMIQKRLLEPPNHRNHADWDDGSVAGKRKRVAFLDLLLQMHREDPSFTLDDVKEEVDTFMFEGHDTTAAFISWAILLIGLHPGVQARLHEEMDQVFEGYTDRPVTAQDLAKLTYLTCVVKETLRLIPPVPAIQRKLEDDIVLDGKVVPKETIITLSIYNLHHDPEQFPEPEAFNPDRFLLDANVKRHPYAYIPFSAGPRNCIGQKFAMMEAKVVLSNLLRRFSFQSVQTIDEAKPIDELVMRPMEGEILVNVSRRK